MVPKPFLSVHIFSTRCEYDILKVSKKGRVERDIVDLGGFTPWVFMGF